MVINPVDDGISKAHEAQLGQWRINRSWQHGYRVCSDPACRILVYETRTFAIQGKLNGGFPRGLLFLFNKIKDQPISCLTEINQTLVVDRKAFSDSSWGRIYWFRSGPNQSQIKFARQRWCSVQPSYLMAARGAIGCQSPIDGFSR